jgi:SAM-dependent methyltransferase
MGHIDLPNDLLLRVKQRRSGLQDRGRRMVEMLQRRLSEHYKIPGNFVALDVGCGVGAASSVLSGQFVWVVGIDPFLSNLILARKFFEEQGIHNVILVQAHAQRMPIRDQCVDFVVAENVIEHLIDVEPAFNEIRRTLSRGGCFSGDSRNRYDLFFPEPHVGLRWVGFWPRDLQSWYVHKRKSMQYEGTSLLSLWELRRYARRAFGSSSVVVTPLASAYGRSPKLEAWLERIDRVPLIRELILTLFPSHILLAQSCLTKDSAQKIWDYIPRESRK